MNDLGANQLGLILHKRVFENLAVSLDRKFAPDIQNALTAQAARAATDPFYALFLNAGLEDPIEQVANLAFPIPRVLYGTTRGNFNPVPAGATARDTHFNRLARFDAVATGGTAFTIPANDPDVGNPCAITVTRDPNSRVTFLRGTFPFTAASLPQVDVVDDALEVTITGQAFQGDFFSRHQALTAPTHNFTMTLRYAIRWTLSSDVNLGPVPFRMVADPPQPGPGASSLPAKGYVVFALRSKDGRKYIPPADAKKSQLASAMFTGDVDDVIYEREGAVEPRFRVEPRSIDEPMRFVLRDLCDPEETILAEAVGGRIYFEFQEATNLTLSPLPGGTAVGGGANQALRSSLVKLQPTLAQSFTCAAGLENAPLSLHFLDLLGPSGLDIPLLQKSLVAPYEARIAGAGDPEPVGSVISTLLEGSLSHTRYFPQSQSFGLSDVEPLPVDVSQGADFTTGFGAGFLDPALTGAEEELANQIKDTGGIPGLDKNSVSAEVRFRDGGMIATISGNGTIKTPFFLPNYGYKFQARTPIRLRAVPAIAVNGEDQPLDRYGCPVPQEVLDHFGLAPGTNRFFLEENATHNPLSFKAYYDPDDGRVCTAGCPPATRSPPAFYVWDETSGLPDRITIPADSAPPPEACGDDPKDDPLAYGERTFQTNPVVKPQWMISLQLPTKDDVEIDIDIKKGALVLTWFIAALLGALFAPLFGALGALGAIGGLIGGLGTLAFAGALILIPAANLIAGAVAKDKLGDQLDDNRPPSFPTEISPSAFLGLYLEAPGSAPEPVEAQEDALLNRYHVVVQSAGLGEAFPT